MSTILNFKEFEFKHEVIQTKNFGSITISELDGGWKNGRIRFINQGGQCSITGDHFDGVFNREFVPEKPTSKVGFCVVYMSGKACSRINVMDYDENATIEIINDHIFRVKDVDYIDDAWRKDILNWLNKAKEASSEINTMRSILLRPPHGLDIEIEPVLSPSRGIKIAYEAYCEMCKRLGEK